MDKNKKIMIIGRSGSGKDTVARYLCEKYGLMQLISTTDRPKRYPDEDTHVFVTTEQAKAMKERVAETRINGYQYFATRQQLDTADIYVIDPRGLADVCKNANDLELCVIYVRASEQVREGRAIRRAENEVEAKEIFRKRSESENEMFDQFEFEIFNRTLNDQFHRKYATVKQVCVINNETLSTTELHEAVDIAWKSVINTTIDDLLLSGILNEHNMTDENLSLYVDNIERESPYVYYEI